MQQNRSQWGRKAGHLRVLQEQGLRVPAFFVLTRGQIEGVDSEQILQTILADTFSSIPPFFAVRSSAAGEDAENLSMAGSFHTELGVTPSQILFATRTVLASYTSSLPTDSVIIQEFIPSDSAGVLFTNAGDGTQLLNATCGLCENAVKGFAVDEYVFDRSGQEMTRTIAPEKQCRFFVNGAFEEHIIDGGKAALGEDQLQELLSMGKRIEGLMGCPQDIEWCFFHGELFILQSRPITRSIREEETFYDSANIAESYTGLVLPLTFSFAEDIYREVYQHLLVASGVSRKIVQSYTQIFSHMLALFHGRIYYNMNNWYRMMSFLPGYERNKKNLEGMITSSVREEVDRRIHPSVWLRLTYGPLVLWKMLFFGRTIRKFKTSVQALIDRMEQNIAVSLSASDLKKLYEELHTELLSRWHITVENDFLVMTYLGILRHLLKDEEALIAMLSFQNVSASQVRSLGTLGKEIFSHSNYESLFQARNYESLWETLQTDSVIHESLQAYFKTYGGRFANELKLESPDLHEDHAMLLLLLHQYAAQDFQQPTQHPERGDTWVIRWVGRAFRKAAGEREVLRLLRSKAFSLVRKIFRSIGAILEKQGDIVHADDLFYLTIPEVFACVEGGLSVDAARILIQSRKEEYKRDADLRLRAHFSARGIPSDADLLDIDTPITSGTILQGKGSTTGTVTGRVMLFPAFHIPDGPVEIVVAEHTDPGWTPLIGLARGMIIEHGGLLSHAAIVARELGIPTVIGVDHALQHLHDGQTVTIDGAKGTVLIHV